MLRYLADASSFHRNGSLGIFRPPIQLGDKEGRRKGFNITMEKKIGISLGSKKIEQPNWPDLHYLHWYTKYLDTLG